MTGKDITLILSQNGTALASTRIRTNDIQTKADTIERSSATQQTWREYIAGRKEWNLTVGYLVLASTQVKDLLMVGQTFDVTMTATNGVSSDSITGQAILEQVKQTGNISNLAQGSFSFRGTGPLTEVSPSS